MTDHIATPRRRHEIELVGRGVVEGDVAPDVERLAQRRAGLGGLGEDRRPFVDIVAPDVAREDHRFERDAVGGRAGLDAHRMADRAAAELQHDVLAEQVEELVHLPGVDAARGDRHQLVERRPVLIEEEAVLEPHRIEVLAADVVVALGRRRIAFELADDGAGVDVVDAGEPHPLGDHAERHAVRLLPRVGRQCPARCRCRIMSFRRAHFAIDWIAV